MQRSVWSGVISFGLVAVPVRLFPATRRRAPQFNLLHRRCGSRIQYRKWCPRCEEELSAEELVRGYEYARGQYVTLEDEDIRGAAGEQTGRIDLATFARLSEIDPVYYDRTYHAVPERAGRRAGALLADALHRHDRVGVGHCILRTKPHLAAVRSGETGLLVQTMYYPDEVTEVPQVEGLPGSMPAAEEVGDAEREMAAQLVTNLSEPFDPGQFSNEYRGRLEELIDGKIAGREIVIPPERPRGEVIDLLEALEKSVEAAEDGEHRG